VCAVDSSDYIRKTGSCFKLRFNVGLFNCIVQTLAAENATLRGSVKSLTEGMSQISDKNKRMKESIIDLQACSMRDNLVFSGILEQADEDPELTIKNYRDTVKNITFQRVHRLEGKRPDACRPRPIVAKF